MVALQLKGCRGAMVLSEKIPIMVEQTIVERGLLLCVCVCE